MANLEMHRLDDEFGITFDEGKDTLTLYGYLDPHDELPQKLTVLPGDTMEALANWWIDGYCCGCNEPIPQERLVCRRCAEEAARAWGIG